MLLLSGLLEVIIRRVILEEFSKGKSCDTFDAFFGFLSHEEDEGFGPCEFGLWLDIIGVLMDDVSGGGSNFPLIRDGIGIKEIKVIFNSTGEGNIKEFDDKRIIKLIESGSEFEDKYSGFGVLSTFIGLEEEFGVRV